MSYSRIRQNLSKHKDICLKDKLNREINEFQYLTDDVFLMWAHLKISNCLPFMNRTYFHPNNYQNSTLIKFIYLHTLLTLKFTQTNKHLNIFLQEKTPSNFVTKIFNLCVRE